MKYTRDEAQQGFDVDVRESVFVCLFGSFFLIQISHRIHLLLRVYGIYYIIGKFGQMCLYFFDMCGWLLAHVYHFSFLWKPELPKEAPLEL